MSQHKRLRIFAGPNGSGKSTIINIVKENGIDMGIYVNADDVKKEFQTNQYLNFNNFGIVINTIEIRNIFQNSTFFDVNTGNALLEKILVENNFLYFSANEHFDIVSTYLADFIRNKLLESCQKFTFETVMSHPSKIDFIKAAISHNFKTYLYFVSLENPELNKDRVKARVKLNGHDVPEEKIVSRYYRTMNLLFDALKEVDEAYFFDNSGSKSVLFAKYSNSEIEILKSVKTPQWFFEYVLNKII